jgi:hypothetical protein
MSTCSAPDIAQAMKPSKFLTNGRPPNWDTTLSDSSEDSNKGDTRNTVRHPVATDSSRVKFKRSLPWGFCEASSVAQVTDKKIKEKNVVGLKYSDQFGKVLLRQLRDVSCDRTRAGHSSLHMDQYRLLVLLECPI